MAGDEEWAAPVEIVGDETASTAEIEGGRPVDWHRVVRSGAAAVAALSLLWIGSSMADERADAKQSGCVNDVQQAYSRYEQLAYMRNWDGRSSPVDRAIAEDLAERARACGGDNAELYAESILYVPADDD